MWPASCLKTIWWSQTVQKLILSDYWDKVVTYFTGDSSSCKSGKDTENLALGEEMYFSENRPTGPTASKDLIKVWLSQRIKMNQR